MADDLEKSPFVLRLEAEMRSHGVADRADLGRRAGIPYHRLNPWWVRATAKPNASDLLTLARLFNVDEEYLLGGGDRRPFRPMAALLRRAEALAPAEQDDLENYLAYLEQKTSHRKSEPE